jgi:hypothetical protein
VRKTRHTYWRWIVATSLATLTTAAIVWRPAYANDRQDDPEGSFQKLRVIGLTADGRLVRFRVNSPGNARDIGNVTGLTGTDTALVGIDFRVQDGLLYGVGNGGGVYTIDPTTASATFVNALTVPLSGTFFGVDFNPAADRLRIVSDTGQNLAHNVNVGGVTAANATLTYTVPPAAAVPALGITGAAYTNNDLNAATATTLLDIDSTQDQVAIQSPPATGLLVANGKLGVDAAPQVGFDIYTRTIKGVAVSNRGFASLVVFGRAAFYRIRPFTGEAIFLGVFDESIVDIAFPLNQDASSDRRNDG